ncbi:MAG: 30S ribosomal protein S11 [Verrucomicrobia bacterium]|jgi:small subunit ribosomal protein S11|nr:30S ribosomal protein S11 [Verrucomicrobiota bacterium]
MAEELEKQAAESAPEEKAAEATAPATAPEVETPAPAAEEAKDAAPAAEEAKDAAPAAEEAKDAAPASEAAPAPAAPPVEKRRGRHGRHVPVGIAHIKATFNNTQVSITDPRGGVVSWSSAGRAGFKGSRKSTAFAATLVAQEAARGAVAKGMHEVEVRVQGAGAGRESAIRGIQSAGMGVSMIKDVTPIAHNGCRARKRRRV